MLIKLVVAVAATCGACQGTDPAPVTDCATGATITVEATASTPCDLDGSQTLNLTWPGADGYDDAATRQQAADYGCATFAVIDGVATGLACDY